MTLPQVNPAEYSVFVKGEIVMISGNGAINRSALNLRDNGCVFGILPKGLVMYTLQKNTVRIVVFPNLVMKW
jgi:hypothetical protein